MKTLLFCTSYATDPHVWEKRIGRWRNWIDSTNLKYDNMLVVDDASSCLPNDLDVVDNIELPSAAVLYRFQDHLGRGSLNYYPGWYRSFILPVQYIEKFGFEKVIHIESDCFLITDKIIEWVNNLNEGWNGLWCPSYRFPETCIQVICESSFDNYFKMSKLSFDEIRTTNVRRCAVNLRKIINRRIRDVGANKKVRLMIAELWTPFTNVCKDFIGDRYGDKAGIVPSNADYACQMHENLVDEMFWWFNTI